MKVFRPRCYASSYLVKQVDQKQAVLREFFWKVESLFHDVVHGLGLETSQADSLYRNTIRIGYLDRSITFSHLFFVTVQKRRNLTGMNKQKATRNRLGGKRKSSLPLKSYFGMALKVRGLEPQD